MPGERDRLLADTLHEIAVGGERVGMMVHELRPERGGKVAFGDRHADRVTEALAERAGRRLHPRRHEILGMAGRQRAKLAEALDLLDRHLLVAEEMEQRVDQHRAVAGRKHETVAVGPGGIGGIELQEPGEQHGRDVGRSHRQTGMAGFRLFDRVHGERADGIRHALVVGTRPRDVLAAVVGGRLRGRDRRCS